MDRQIVDPDPDKNYNAAISAADPHLEKINLHRSRPNHS